MTNAVAVSLHEPVTVPPFVLLKQNSAKLGQWYELTGEVSVRSALAWAEENVGVFRTFSLYAVFDMPWPGETPRELNSHRVMVRLYGVDPTRNDEDEPRWPTEFYAREQWFGAHEGHEPKADDAYFGSMPKRMNGLEPSTFCMARTGRELTASDQS